MKKLILGSMLAGVMVHSFTVQANDDLATIEKLARQEGVVNSVGMPDTWANWKDTWQQITAKYQLEHVDTDMSSAQEIAKFSNEKYNASADIGDVGISFGPIAVKKGVTQPYKPTTWQQIPQWAKDKEGHWAVAYTGTIAFIVNKRLVKDIPTSWRDLLNGQYVVTVGDMLTGAQSVNALLAASYSFGGDEKNLMSGIEFFQKLAKQNRLNLSNPTIASLEKEEVEVAIMWDFNGLNYRDIIDRDRFEVLIPSDGSVMSGYTTIINRFAKHPNAAKLAREYIFSDQGQINLALGYARPIRSEFITFPAEAQNKLLPAEQYKNVYIIKDFDVWEKTTRTIPQLWQEHVVSEMQ